MKHLKKTFALLMLLTLVAGSRIFAQDYFRFATAQEVIQQIRAKEQGKERAMEVMQDNEYDSTGYEQGIFASNPLMLDGKPLDYSTFSISSKGELTVIKVATANGQTMQIPFYVYLRRNGAKVLFSCKNKPNPKQIKIDILRILKAAKPGDQLIIEPVNKEDGPAKRILKLLGNGC